MRIMYLILFLLFIVAIPIYLIWLDVKYWNNPRTLDGFRNTGCYIFTAEVTSSCWEYSHVRSCLNTLRRYYYRYAGYDGQNKSYTIVLRFPIWHSSSYFVMAQLINDPKSSYLLYSGNDASYYKKFENGAFLRMGFPKGLRLEDVEDDKEMREYVQKTILM